MVADTLQPARAPRRGSFAGALQHAVLPRFRAPFADPRPRLPRRRSYFLGYLFQPDMRRSARSSCSERRMRRQDARRPAEDVVVDLAERSCRSSRCQTAEIGGSAGRGALFRRGSGHGPRWGSRNVSVNSRAARVPGVVEDLYGGHGLLSVFPGLDAGSDATSAGGL